MAVLSALAASFAFQMRMEEKAAFNYWKSSQARAIAMAGVDFAVGTLENDESDTYDSFDDYWAKPPYDGKWHTDNNLITNHNGDLVGVYKVKITDLSGKLNINTCGKDQNEGWSPYEESFKNFLDAGGWNLGTSNSAQLANNLLAYRYGTDGYPGNSGDDDADSIIVENDGIDNNGNGQIDEPGEGVNEPDEFVYWKPYLDSSGINSDTPFITREEIQKVNGIKGDTYNIYNDISSFITPFSFDLDINDSGINRVNLNYAEASTIDTVLIQEGIAEDTALQLAANIADYRDRNNYATILYDKDGNPHYGVEGIQINEVMPRTWAKLNAVGHAESDNNWILSITRDYYESNTNGSVGHWSWNGIKPGKYYLRIYRHTSSTGKVEISVDGGNTYSSPMTPTCNYGPVDIDSSGTLDLKIRNYDGGASDIETCTFYYATLSQQSQYIELYNISDKQVDLSGWKVSVYDTRQPVTSGAWWDGYLPSGTYLAPHSYLLAVARKDKNSTVGVSASPPDDTSFESGWGNNNGTWDSSDGDTPIVELVPPTDHPYGFGLNFFSNVENDDTPRKDYVDRGDTIIIYDMNLNPVCWTYFPDADSAAGDSIPAFTSLEKSDPTIYQRGWSYTDSTQEDSVPLQGTPGGLNTGVSTTDLDKLRVKDNPFATVGELWRVKGMTKINSEDWQRMYQIKTDDGSDTYIMTRLPDRFTVSGKRLEAENASQKYTPSSWRYAYTDPSGHEIDATHPDTPFLTPYYYNFSNTDKASWGWGLRERISPDTSVYNLYVLGLKGAPFKVSVNTWNENFNNTNWVYLIPGPDGIAYYGEVIVGDSDTEHSLSDTYIQVSIKKPDTTSATYFNGIVLTPSPRIYGRINVNTADTEVLHALPGNIFSPASNFIEERIYNDSPYLSSGEIVESLKKYYDDHYGASWTEDEKWRESWKDFSRISNLVTVRGKLFRIDVTGRYIRDTNGNGSYDEGIDDVLGEYKISTIYER